MLEPALAMPERSRAGANTALRVTTVIPAHDRPGALARVLSRLERQPVDEVIVVDNASSADITTAVVGSRTRYIGSATNLGVEARNVGARATTAELLLMLDDDSYPQPGAVEAMRTLFERYPDLGAVGGKVVDVHESDEIPFRTGEEVGSFDWFSHYGIRDVPDGEPIPAFFAAEGACMIGHQAFVEAGGFSSPVLPRAW